MLRPAAAGLEGSDAHPAYPTRGSATPAVRSAAVRMSGTVRPTVSDRDGSADETPSGGSVKRQRNRARPCRTRDGIRPVCITSLRNAVLGTPSVRKTSANLSFGVQLSISGNAARHSLVEEGTDGIDQSQSFK